jgi:hypothetical protein
MKFLIPACILTFFITSCGGKSNNTNPINNEDPSKSIPDYYTPENPITPDPETPNSKPVTTIPKKPDPRLRFRVNDVNDILKVNVQKIEFTEENDIQTKEVNIQNISPFDIEIAIEIDQEKNYTLNLITKDCDNKEPNQITENTSNKKLLPAQSCKVSIQYLNKCTSVIAEKKDFTQLKIKIEEHGTLEIPISICSKLELDPP